MDSQDPKLESKSYEVSHMLKRTGTNQKPPSERVTSEMVRLATWTWAKPVSSVCWRSTIPSTIWGFLAKKGFCYRQ